MIDRKTAETHAKSWIAAWNSHDLPAIMAHYAEPLEFVSPLVIERLARADGTIRDLAKLRAYFAASLGPDSDLRFDMEDVFVGVSSWTIVYRNHRGQRIAEVETPNEDGKIVKAVIHRL